MHTTLWGLNSLTFWSRAAGGIKVIHPVNNMWQHIPFVIISPTIQSTSMNSKAGPGGSNPRTLRAPIAANGPNSTSLVQRLPTESKEQAAKTLHFYPSSGRESLSVRFGTTERTFDLSLQRCDIGSQMFAVCSTIWRPQIWASSIETL